MVSEIGIKQYYEQFRKEALQEIKECDAELARIEPDLARFRNEILDVSLSIKNSTGVDVKQYKSEFYNIKYDADSDLQDKMEEYHKRLGNATAKINVGKVLMYIGFLKTKYEQNQLKNFAINKLKITPGEFKEYIGAFYKYGVSKCLLQGYGYRFNYNIGILLICNIQRKTPWRNLDVRKTNENKKKLLEAGLKPYDKKEAEIAKLRGVKYDGVPYQVFQTIENYDKLFLLKSTKRSKGKFVFKPSKSDAGLKKNSVEKICETVKTEEDIYKINCGIRIKMLIYKKCVPGCTLKYIRNVKRGHYVGNFNSQDRQRFQS